MSIKISLVGVVFCFLLSAEKVFLHSSLFFELCVWWVRTVGWLSQRLQLIARRKIYGFEHKCNFLMELI